jgi:hypothetical protein
LRVTYITWTNNRYVMDLMVVKTLNINPEYQHYKESLISHENLSHQYHH